MGTAVAGLFPCLFGIPAERMKVDGAHHTACPPDLTLHTLKKVTGDGKYLLPSARTNERAMSYNTINAPLHHLGYTKEGY